MNQPSSLLLLSPRRMTGLGHRAEKPAHLFTWDRPATC